MQHHGRKNSGFIQRLAQAGPLPHPLGGLTDAHAGIVVGEHFAGDLHSLQQGDGAGVEDAQGAGKAGGVETAADPTDHRQAQYHLVPATTTLVVGQPPAPDQAANAKEQQEPEAVVLQQLAGADEETGGARQLLAHVFELGHHLGHHGGEQYGDDPHRHQGEDDGIDHRLQQLGAHVLALLGVIGETVEHLLQVTGLLAGRHHGAEQLVEHMGEGPQRIGQGIPLHHLAAHRRHQAAQVGLLALFGDRLEGLLDGETGPHQGRQLAGDEGQFCGGGTTAKQHEAVRLPFGLLGGLVHLEGGQPLLAQQLAHLAGGIPFQHAALVAPLAVEGLVFKCRHLSLPGSRAAPLRGWSAP